MSADNDDDIDSDWFFETVRRLFSPVLDAHGFAERERRDDRTNAPYIEFMNATTAVGIEYDRLEHQCNVVLFRLQGRKEPRFSDPRRPGRNLAALARLRGRGDSVPRQFLHDPQTREHLESILRRYLQLVQNVASDVLSGDFSAFEALEEHERAAAQRIWEHQSEEQRAVLIEMARGGSMGDVATRLGIEVEEVWDVWRPLSGTATGSDVLRIARRHVKGEHPDPRWDDVSDEDRRVLSEIARSESFPKAASRLGIAYDDLMRTWGRFMWTRLGQEVLGAALRQTEASEGDVE